MTDITLIEFLTKIGVNAPFALVIWFMWRHIQRLEKLVEEAQNSERETLKEQLNITRNALLKAGLDADS